MLEVVVVPTCKRPEMLALSLEAIGRIPDYPPIIIFPDRGTVFDDLLHVMENYAPRGTGLSFVPQDMERPDVPSGFWNILRALKGGHEAGTDLIYIVEEDVIVRPDFFNWHRQAQAPELMATCGRRIPWLPNYDQYTNPGSCFSHERLGMVIPHINSELFSDSRKYIDKIFGRMDEVSTLDDGLIRRIAKANGLKVKYPDTPKCSHIGFGAYNRYRDWDNTEGTVQQRIEKLRQMISTMSNTNRYTRDWEPIGVGSHPSSFADSSTSSSMISSKARS